MEEVLFKIPLTRWIHGNIEKMNRLGKTDLDNWSDCWFTTYKELGGKSDSSGSKGCPQHAAYELWQLGRIKDTNIPHRQIPIKFIKQRYGRNAAYAEIALDLLEKGQAAQSETDLWFQVQGILRTTIHENPAESQQGAVTVARALFDKGQIVTG